MPSEQALAAGVIQLYAQKLKKVVVADELQIAPGEVTDSELTVLCDSIRDDPPDILVLCGCRGVTDIFCLMQLSTISHLDISRCGLGAEGGFQLAGAIEVMRALSHFDISNNNIRQEGMQALAEALKGNVTVTALIVSSNNITYDAKGDPGKMAGVIALANAIPGMGAMTKFDICSNNLRAEGGNALAAGLKGNQVITELNISSNSLGINSDYGSHAIAIINSLGSDTSGVIAIADAISNMGALFSLTFSGEQYWNGTTLTEDAITITTAMTDADVSGKHLGFLGATILAAWLSSDKGGLSLANVMGNGIGKEMLSNLQEIMRSKPNLVSLCGIADDATEADLSSLNMDADDAIILASELPNKRALATLVFGGDGYPAAGRWIIPEPATLEVGMSEVDFSNKGLGASGAIIISAWITHKGKGALLSLNISNNNIGEITALPPGWTKREPQGWFDPQGNIRSSSEGPPPGSKSEGVTALANIIKTNGALSVLSLKSNGLLTKESGKVLADALKGNSILTELDISSNYDLFNSSKDGPGFAQELAVGIRDSRALVKLDISSNYIGAVQEGGIVRALLARRSPLAGAASRSHPITTFLVL
jgi:hypothetical protein